MKNLTAIRHGEIMLVPVAAIPSGKSTKHDLFIVGHSETGHHHVLVGKHLKYGKITQFEVTEAGDDLYFRLFEPGTLEHKKTNDRHRDLTIPAGIYKRYHDTEYDVWEKITRDVSD